MIRRLALLQLLLITACATHTAPVETRPTPRAPEIPLSEVTSIDRLPRDIQEALGRFKSGAEGIADRGWPFSAGDVSLYDDPRRRFVVAGVNASRVLVCLEYGGYSYGVSALLYEYNDGGWRFMAPLRLSMIPRVEGLTLTDLLKLLPKPLP
jgi:hypothetical protein